MSLRELVQGGEKLAEVGVGAGKVKSESVDEHSELLEMLSNHSCLTKGPAVVELDLDAVDKIVFSSETWFDMQYIILKHTRSYLELVN